MKEIIAILEMIHMSLTMTQSSDLSMASSAESKVTEVRDVYSSFVVELGDCNGDKIKR